MVGIKTLRWNLVVCTEKMKVSHVIEPRMSPRVRVEKFELSSFSTDVRVYF